MTVTVKAFAKARELLGPSRALALPAGATVGDAWQALCAECPVLSGFALRGLAVNRQYAPFEQVLAEGDELAVIPPVSGG